MNEPNIILAALLIYAIGAVLAAVVGFVSYKISCWYYMRKWDRAWREVTGPNARR